MDQLPFTTFGKYVTKIGSQEMILTYFQKQPTIGRRCGSTLCMLTPNYLYNKQPTILNSRGCGSTLWQILYSPNYLYNKQPTNKVVGDVDQLQTRDPSSPYLTCTCNFIQTQIPLFAILVKIQLKTLYIITPIRVESCRFSALVHFFCTGRDTGLVSGSVCVK